MRRVLRSAIKDHEAVLASTQNDLDQQIAQALDALAPENQPPLRAAENPPVESSGSGSSQSVGTTVVPNADDAIMTAASVSMQDRQSRLTSLLHHLTVDLGAADQELPMAGPLPAPWVGGSPQIRRVDNASVGFSGDRALLEQQNRLARTHSKVPSAGRARTGWQFRRLFVIAGVTGMLVGWGIVLLLLPSGMKAANETVQAETPPPEVAANVESATGVPPLVHDSPPTESTELPVAANVPSTTGVPPRAHDSLPQENTEPKVQSATEVPPPISDGPAQANAPPLRAAETPPVQGQKGGLSQSIGGPLVLDADEIAALVKRGQDFATNGDLVSARLLLRRAAEAGSAEAALALGETFDPIVFQRLHVIGIEPDAASAQKWYQRAAELGAAAASQHLAKPADRAP